MTSYWNQVFSKLKMELIETQSDVLVCKYVLLQQKGVDIWTSYSFQLASGAAEARQFIYANLPDSVWNNIYNIGVETQTNGTRISDVVCKAMNLRSVSINKKACTAGRDMLCLCKLFLGN